MRSLIPLKSLNRKRGWCLAVLSCAVAIVCTTSLAWQRGGWRGRPTDDRDGVPIWETDSNYKSDVFTFVRIRYADGNNGRRGRWGQSWRIDYPASDYNLSMRLQQLTSIKVNPFPEILDLTDPRLFDFPFIYMIEPGAMLLSDEEAKNLRHYCLNGGFLMVDDFWGDDEYKNFYDEIKKAFPDREPKEVPLSHEIFQCVYKLTEKPQVPSVGDFYNGRTHEYRSGSDTRGARYLAIENDDNRIMVFICHNTDLGDGWEREGENRDYFAEYAVKKSYPMGINIITYAMTH